MDNMSVKDFEKCINKDVIVYNNFCEDADFCIVPLRIESERLQDVRDYVISTTTLASSNLLWRFICKHFNAKYKYNQERIIKDSDLSFEVSQGYFGKFIDNYMSIDDFEKLICDIKTLLDILKEKSLQKIIQQIKMNLPMMYSDLIYSLSGNGLFSLSEIQDFYNYFVIFAEKILSNKEVVAVTFVEP